MTTEEHNMLEDVYETRLSMPSIYDINPGKEDISNCYFALWSSNTSSSFSSCMNVAGYSKFSFMMPLAFSSYASIHRFCWCYKDGTTSEYIEIPRTSNTWFDYDIPANTLSINFQLKSTASAGDRIAFYYSLLV